MPPSSASRVAPTPSACRVNFYLHVAFPNASVPLGLRPMPYYFNFTAKFVTRSQGIIFPHIPARPSVGNTAAQSSRSHALRNVTFDIVA